MAKSLWKIIAVMSLSVLNPDSDFPNLLAIPFRKPWRAIVIRRSCLIIVRKCASSSKLNSRLASKITSFGAHMCALAPCRRGWSRNLELFLWIVLKKNPGSSNTRGESKIPLGPFHSLPRFGYVNGQSFILTFHLSLQLGVST